VDGTLSPQPLPLRLQQPSSVLQAELKALALEAVDRKAAAVLPMTQGRARLGSQPEAKVGQRLAFLRQGSTEVQAPAFPGWAAVDACGQGPVRSIALQVAAVGADLPAPVAEAALVLQAQPAPDGERGVAGRCDQQRLQ